MVKVLAVGRIPPPYLGLPIMLEYLVRSRMQGIQLRHLQIVLSNDESGTGKFGWKKMFRLFPIIVRIIYARLAHGPQILYYAPAGATRISMFRDIVLLGCTRFLFPKTIFHFHASGHGDLYERLPRWQRRLFRWAFFHADGAVRLSELAPDDARRLEARHEFIVPNGIRDPGLEMRLPRASISISAERPLRVLFVALLCEGKGLLVLLDACAELAARRVPFELKVMGRFESEAFKARVRSRVDELQIGDRVQFLGVLAGADKFAVFAHCDVLCHPTFYDTLPVVVLEAMASALPVVATRWSSIPLVVDDGETGFLVEPHDAVQVADRLAELAESPRLRQEMGIAGRKKFLREFTLDRHVERMRRVFLAVAGELPKVESCETPEDLAMASAP